MPHDRWTLSLVAHARLASANPLDGDDLERALDVISATGARDHARALDVGCGKGDLVSRLADRGYEVTGYDASPPAVAFARARLAGRPGVTILEATEPPPGPFDLVACIGSSGALVAGSVGAGLVAAASLAAPGGLVLLADGFWARPPDPGLLAALGAEPDEMADLDATRALVAAAGVDVQFEQVASPEQWARYESGWQAGLRTYVADHADDHNPDPDAARFAAAADAAEDRVARWPDTIGFVLLAGRVTG